MSAELLIGVVGLVVTTLGFGFTVASLLHGFSTLKARDRQTHELLMRLVGNDLGGPVSASKDDK